MEAGTDVNVFPVFSQLHASVKPGPQLVTAKPITQLELELLLALRNRLAQLEAQIAAEEATFTARLQAGASVESGVHIAELKENSRRSVAWKEVVVRLATRLKLGGEAYCARVLASTKPTRSISLEIS